MTAEEVQTILSRSRGSVYVKGQCRDGTKFEGYPMYSESGINGKTIWNLHKRKNGPPDFQVSPDDVQEIHVIS